MPTAHAFMEDPATLYRNVSEDHRRLVLAALFDRLYIHQGEMIEAEMREPFGDLQKWHTAVVGQSTIEDQVAGAVTTRRPRNDRSAGPGRALRFWTKHPFTGCFNGPWFE